MPLLANWPLEVIEQELAEVGVYLIEKFGDGQTRWGTEPLREPYGGQFTMASEYRPNAYDMFTVRAILNRLDKAGAIPTVEKELYARLGEVEPLKKRRGKSTNGEATRSSS